MARSLRASPRFRGRLVGLTFDHRFTGAYASYFDAVHLIPPPAAGERPFLRAIRDIARSAGIDVLVPTLDPEALLCAALSRSLARLGVKTLLPPEGAIRRCAKTALAAVARRAGFEVPRTLLVASRAALEAALRQLPLPFFLKGSFADSRLVVSAEHADLEFGRLSARWGLPLLAQERVAGDEVDVALLYDRGRRCVGAVPMRKLGLTAEGKAWAGVTIDAPDLVRQARRLLERLGWVGAAELELIRDPTSGVHRLIEVNPRFPAWIYLATACGANLPWALVRTALGERVTPFPASPPGTLFTRTTEDHFCPVARAEGLAAADAWRGQRA